MRTTVFVVGAGASSEAKLPTGIELKDEISKLLKIRMDANSPRTGDDAIIEALRTRTVNDAGGSFDAAIFHSYLNQALHISKALTLAPSIDNFLDTHRNNEKLTYCGKLGIVRAILEAERRSLLRPANSKSERPRLSDLQHTWFNSFFQLLTINCDIHQVEERLRSTALIVFNYDRCIEHFLFEALQLYYAIKPDEAAALISQLKIIHPYGTVGDLPWMGGNTSTEFGASPPQHEMDAFVRQIKTFTESIESEEIRSSFSEARKFIFLGFAFHDLNMELLKLTTKPRITPLCFATTRGFSSSDMKVIDRQIKGLFHGHGNVELEDMTCADLFRNYSKSLAI